MKKLSILLPVLLFMIISCQKEKNKDTTDEIVFEGITMTDECGNFMSQDTTDWKFTDNWTDKENALFIEKRDNICNINDFKYSIIAYPNPYDGIFSMEILKPENSRLAIRMVDQDFNVLISNDSITSHVIALTFRDLNLSNEIVRIYYKILSEDCELRGHGDIQIK